MTLWRNLRAPLLLALAALLSMPEPPARRAAPGTEAERDEAGPYPADWFLAQRAYPFESVPQEKFQAAVQQALAERAIERAAKSGGGTLAAGPLTWTEAGPFNIGGRVTALEALPGGATVYLGSANGGVFKSTDSGTSWDAIFDATGQFSIGALAIDPTNANTIWVGTGEANASVDSYDGAGVYVSHDAGATWAPSGLAATARIGRIAVDPTNPQRVYAATMGTQFSTGPDRGLDRTENGGQTWSRMLFLNDSTGVTDVVLNPAHPETVYCATWERVRRLSYRRAFGPGSGIWRSPDRGVTWTRLTSGLPTPTDSVGRIALAISPARPTRIYAQITSGAGLGYVGLGLYRSDNVGQNWARRDVATSTFVNAFGGFCWYFGAMAVDPNNADRIFALGQVLIRSLAGGSTWSDVTGAAHVDFHAFWIDPTNSNRMYCGSDGGFFRSMDAGTSWEQTADLPITQFYAGAIDATSPTHLLGGTQDNGTLATYGAPTSWTALGIGGDGFQCMVDPVTPNVVFAEWQYCCSNTGPRRSTNGGASFGPAPAGIVGSDRFNWCTPMVMNPRNHNVLLVGSQRVYRSVNNGLSYATISPNLTTDPPTSLVYGTITTLDISPADTNVYYAGTDDAKVWRSVNRGASWTDISPGLPVRYVTRVTADPADPQVVYATLSGFGLDEHLPHVYRSGDRGTTWTSIASNLPDVPANDLVVDPADPRTLFLATDVGVYWTRDTGASWVPLGWGMPVQTIFDLSFHAPSRTLVAATHGRSQWALDLTPVPVAVADAPRAPRLALGAPAPNPASGPVRFSLELPTASAMDVTIYDAAGRRVRVIASGRFEAARHDLSWDGLDERGRPSPAGVYFVRAVAGGSSAIRRVVRER